MDRLADDQLLALTGSRPEAFGVFYRRHETTVLRFFMERLRAPDLAADLTAETFAAALAQARRFDPARRPPLEWLLALANTQLLRAYRVGEVDRTARAGLRVAPVTLDDRALDRVWQLRGPDRRTETKPRRSAGVLLAEPPRGGRTVSATTVAAWWTTTAAATATSAGRAKHAAATATTAGQATTTAAPAAMTPVAASAPAATVLPGVADALVVAAARAHGGRRRRRRAVLGARIALALVTVTWFVGEAVIPDRPASASSTVWLPFESAHDVAGDFPQLWYHASSRQAPPFEGARELATFTTYETGDGTDPRCGGLRTLGDADALVSVLDRPGADPSAVPDRPEHFRARRSPEVERALRSCRSGLRASWLPFRDGDRVLAALVVLGPSAGKRTEAVAQEILDRVRVGSPSL